MNTDKLLEMLLDAIDYSFLQNDGSYDKTLTYPVIDKIQYIKEQLKNNEPICEDMEEASKNYALNNTPWDDCKDEIQESFKAGAKWKEQKMMAKAIDAQCFGFQGAALFSFRLPADNYLVGSEVKVIVIKED